MNLSGAVCAHPSPHILTVVGGRPAPVCEVGHEAGVSDCVCMSAKQSISLLADSSWSLGQYRSPGKPSVTTVPTRHLLDTD